MSQHARQPTRHLIWLALIAIIGLVGLFVTTGAAKTVFFLITCWPLLIGTRGYLRHRAA